MSLPLKCEDRLGAGQLGAGHQVPNLGRWKEGRDMATHGATVVEKETGMIERTDLEDQIRGLKRLLDDAWWNEEPLETIQKLEQQIANRSQALQSTD